MMININYECNYSLLKQFNMVSNKIYIIIPFIHILIMLYKIIAYE